MTATTISTVPTTRRPAPAPSSGTGLWRTGAQAGVYAAVATPTFAAIARGLGVSVKIDGQAIALPGFAVLTIAGAIIGTMLAVLVSRRARQPRRTFARTTIALTLLSIVPDVIVNAQVTTKVTLALTHVVAAAIVIPALASRLRGDNS